MARTKTHTPLQVFLNGRRVGALNRKPSGAIDFTYDPTWLNWENAIPVSRSLPPRPESYIGEKVTAVFENLLPDNDTIRRTIADRVGASGVDAFGLLSSIGRDCVGALQFVPEGQDPGSIDQVKATPISEKQIAHLLRNLGRTPLGLEEDSDFRISLAGAQEKTALLWTQGKWHKPLGATPTTHIFKPDIGKTAAGMDLTNSVENEYLCLLITKELGLKTAEVEMRRFEDQHALVVTRFDRIWTQDGRLLRRPQEDCCQALSVPPTRKYETSGGPSMVDVLHLLKESDTPHDDQLSFLKAQIIFWMIGATDAHAKNFSIFLSPGGRFSMTPLYDVISILPIFSTGQIGKNKMKMAMSLGNNRHYPLSSILPRHFIETAEKTGLTKTVVGKLFSELAERVPTAIENIEKILPRNFPSRVSEPILKTLLRQSKLLTG